MDFSGNELVYFYKRPISQKKEKGPDFCVCIYNISTNQIKEICEFPDKISHMMIFENGLVYVSENKQVWYYDLKTESKQLLYIHPFTILTMDVYNALIVTIDK